MNVKFVSLEWEKGEAPYLLQGVRGGRRPSGALYGGNGSFMMPGKPASLYLKYEGESGEIGKRNIIYEAKGINDWQKLSQKRVDTLERKLEKLGTFDIDDSENYRV